MREPRIRTGPLWQMGLGRQNGLAFWGLFFIEGSFGAFMPIWPLFMEELGAPITIVGLLLGLGGVFRFFTLLPTAALARRIGGKQVLFWCRLIYTVAIAGAVLAPSWPWLLPVLIGQSVGSMAFPIILSHVSAHAGERGKVRAFSLVVTIGPSIALLIAPLLSSGLISVFGLRSPFLLSALFSFLGIVVLSRISDKEDLPIEEEGTDEQASYGAVLRHAPVRNILLLKLVTVFVLGLGTSLIPNYLREAGGYSDDLISLLTAFSALGTIGFGAMVVRNQRFSAAPLLGATIAVGAVSLGFLLLLMPEIIPFVIIAFLFRGGVFASISLFSAVLGELSSVRNREHVFTLSEMFIVFGFSFAPIVAGLLFNLWPALPLLVSALGAIPVVLLLLRVNAMQSAGELEPVPIEPLPDTLDSDD